GKNLINENVIDTISVIDTSTDKVIKEIPMGELPDAIAINNYGSFNFDSPYMVYVKNTNLDGSALNTVTVIDGSINRIQQELSLTFIHPMREVSGAIIKNIQ